VKELLEAGVHVHFYLKGFTHSKLMIVDNVFSSVGTANMDIRSFNQDFEANALIYDEDHCYASSARIIEDDMRTQRKFSWMPGSSARIG
jgi:cardiolipin synthase A/B